MRSLGTALGKSFLKKGHRHRTCINTEKEERELVRFGFHFRAISLNKIMKQPIVFRTVHGIEETFVFPPQDEAEIHRLLPPQTSGNEMKLSCSAYSEQARIPTQYTGDGTDVSPALVWQGVPEGTKELAIICDDPDAPSPQPWVHWLLYKIPPTVSQLPEDLPKGEIIESPLKAYQGRNSWPSGQTVGYRGPAPPPGHGTHHYHLTLYALDAELAVQPGIDKAALLAAMQGHILAQAETVGTYSR